MAQRAASVDDEGQFFGLVAAQLSAQFVAPPAKSTTGPAAPLTYVNAADYGAVPGNTGNQAPALQAAINAAGVGGTVRVPAGVYRCTGGLTLPAYATLEASNAMFGADTTTAVELNFVLTGAIVAVTAGAFAVLRNITLRGPGTAVGTCKGVTGASLTLDNAAIINFKTGVHLTNAYYAVAIRCEFSRNGTGLQLTGCYNINLIAPRFYCGSTVVGAANGVAISGAARGLNIYGGSVEGYTSAILVAGDQHVGLFGVYFETDVDANAGGIWADGRDNVSVTAVGCMVFLNGHSRWITMSGSTDASLFARGNHFVAVDASVQAPIAYIISPDQVCDIGGDNWGEVVKAGSTYVSATTGGIPSVGSVVTMPAGHVSAGIHYDGRRQLPINTLQSLAAAGAVTFDAKKGDQLVTLTANATSSTISNTVAGGRQELAITWIQDATGGRTYVWPPTCKFAGNAIPADTTPNTRTTVRFRYDVSVNRWYELSRAVAVPN